MPNNKKKKSKSHREKVQKRQNGHQPPNASVAELIAAADHQAAQDEADQALSLYTAAIQQLEVESNDSQRVELVQVLQKRAELFVAVQDRPSALRDFERALQLEMSSAPSDPTTAATLHLYMGQLQEGRGALGAYRQGVQGLQQCLQQQQGADLVALQETQTQLAAACCSIAELYLTDLCLEENAEAECESYIQQALQYTDASGEPIVDALQTVASLRISQHRPDEAVDSILRAYEKMRVGCEALSTLVGIRSSSSSAQSQPQQQQASELLEVEEVQDLPGFEFRCQTAKLLLECANLAPTRQAQCVEAALNVVGSLLAENDEVIEIWHLAGTAFGALRPPQTELAVQYYERALEMLAVTKESLQQDLLETEDEEAEGMLEQQLEEVNGEEEEIRCRLDELQNEQPQRQLEE